jgi:hypothetical protein
MQLQAQARLKKRARHPAGREAEQPARFIEGGFDGFLDVLLEGLQFGDVFVSHKVFRSCFSGGEARTSPSEQGSRELRLSGEKRRDAGKTAAR